MAKKLTKISAESILLEIDKILTTSKFYQSRESGKRFYTASKFPALLSTYVDQVGGTNRASAYRFGMSTGSLKKIIEGGPLSENMLVRIRSALQKESNANLEKMVFPGTWCNTSSTKVSAAITQVSDRLVFLKQVIEGSNSLNSPNPPIDKIQIAQLIALLTSTLEALRAPYIDKKQTSGFFKWLGKFAKVSLKKGAEEIVVNAMGDAANAGIDFVQHLSSQSSMPDIGNILT